MGTIFVQMNDLYKLFNVNYLVIINISFMNQHLNCDPYNFPFPSRKDLMSLNKIDRKPNN